MRWISTEEHSGCVAMCWRSFRLTLQTGRCVWNFLEMRSSGSQISMCLTGEIKSVESHAAIFPASHYVVPQEQIRRAADAILEEMKQQVEYFKSEDKLIEAQRIAERTNFDVEMMKETGFCSGIENYSRHLTGLAPGQPPYTLMDYFRR